MPVPWIPWVIYLGETQLGDMIQIEEHMLSNGLKPPGRYAYVMFRGVFLKQEIKECLRLQDFDSKSLE